MHQRILTCMELWRGIAKTAGALVVMCAALAVAPSTLLAQTASPDSPGKEASIDSTKPHASNFRALLLDGNYAKPVRANVGASLFFSPEDIANSTEGGRGLIVGGSVGPGGTQVWVGGATFSNVGNTDFRGVFTRTWDNPRGASPNSTYVGGEIGWGLGFRLSAGYAKRISGPSTDDGHIFTWGIGLEIPIWR